MKRAHKLLAKHLDPLESDRYLSDIKYADPNATITWVKLEYLIKKRLDKDSEKCAKRGFQKLDILNSSQISISLMKQALKGNMRSFDDTVFKNVSQEMIRKLIQSEHQRLEHYTLKEFCSFASVIKDFRHSARQTIQTLELKK